MVLNTTIGGPAADGALRTCLDRFVMVIGHGLNLGLSLSAGLLKNEGLK
jgi:hypothetical protein